MVSTSMTGPISPELLICLDDFSSTSHSNLCKAAHAAFTLHYASYRAFLLAFLF